MGVSFNYIPDGSSQRLPLFYAEVDNSQANIFSNTLKSLILAQKLSSGTADANLPFLPASQLDVETKCGRGSMAARMYQFYRKSDPNGELWIIPIPENASGVAQQGTITVTGPATAAGTINLYIAGQRVQVGVAAADTATEIATAIKDAINAATTLPVTATSSSGVVTWTCRWKGETGADIQVIDSYYGTAGGEKLPAGVALAYAYTTAGETNPILDDAITAMGDEQYDFVIHPFTDTTSLTALSTELGDVTGRWSYLRQLYGHAYTAKRGEYADLVTFGDGLADDPHQTAVGFEPDVQQPSWEFIASRIGAEALALNADITRPVQTLAMQGITPPRRGYAFTKVQNNTLLGYGIGCSFSELGVMRVAREPTTYRHNALGEDDISYFDSEDMHKHAYIIRRLRSVITSKYGRVGLANDGTRIAPGRQMVTPGILRGEIVLEYKRMEYEGLVENSAAFEANLIVERDSENPNRVNVLYPPDITNALRVFAVLYQFRLEYSSPAA